MMASTKPRSSMISAKVTYMMPMRLWSTLVSHSLHSVRHPPSQVITGDDDERATDRDQRAAHGDPAVERQGIDGQLAEHLKSPFFRASIWRADDRDAARPPVYFAMIVSNSFGSTAE